MGVTQSNVFISQLLITHSRTTTAISVSVDSQPMRDNKYIVSTERVQQQYVMPTDVEHYELITIAHKTYAYKITLSCPFSAIQVLGIK